jgi:hypothetical protein
MENNITRTYPSLKDEELYNRYTKENFEKYEEIKKSIENYEKWKNGINYETNKKIKIGGEKHVKMGYKNFYIMRRKTFYNYEYVLFTELNGINIEKYIEDTEKLEKYNKKVEELIDKINKLEKWNDYVEFEEIKYGIQKIYNNIHYENDCGGNIIKTEIRVRECRECSGTTSFKEPCACVYKTKIECIKCGYKE